MSTLPSPPANYLLFNEQNTKKLAVVVDIPGLDYLTSTTIGRTIRYGDPIHYGDPGLLYGSLIALGTIPGERAQKVCLSLNSSLTIQQTLEPEQGRASISTLQMSFVDVDQYITQAISPGVLIPEILGREVRVWIGYANTSFPRDYYNVWRGRVAQTIPKIGVIQMQFVDPSIVRRQQIFNFGTTKLSNSVGFTYAFTLSSPATWSLGDVYAVGGNNYTALANGSSSEIMIASGDADPPGTGTLTVVEGVGTSSVAYTDFHDYQFILPSAVSVGFGAIYTHNGHNYTIGLAVGNVLNCTGTGAPLATGVLTKSSGAGPATLNFTSSATDPADDIINVLDASLFCEKILGPDGSYDQNIKCYLKIEDEYIEYQQTGQESDGFSDTALFNVSRGARLTSVAGHAIGTQVDNYVELSGHAIDIALKLMLSGWGGPYSSNNTVASFVTTNDAEQPTVAGAVCLPEDTDAVRDLGIAIGDWLTITGATNAGNNTTCQVTGFLDSLETSNRIILTGASLVAESPTSAAMAVRSQYDTLPDLCGVRMPGQEVDVAGHVYLKNTFLLNSANSYRFFLSNGDADAGKTFIENQVFLPLGAYSLTRQGLISVGLTKPPLADERSQTIDATNVIEPQNIQVTRALNNRKYFNEIDWTYDYDDNGNAQSFRDTLDADSLNLIGLSSILPIDSKGMRTDLDVAVVIADRERSLFLRYANACILIDVKVNFGIGNLIEAGDIIILNDSGKLQIPNLSTGVRNLGIQLLEVINRSLDLKSGNVQLQLQGGIGAQVNDRYATISPSSFLTADSTTSRIVIEDSFGAIFPGAEWKKWQDYIGLKVRIHSPDFSDDEEVTFTGLDPANNYALLLSPALSFTPSAGYVLDIAQYSTSTDYNDQALAKLIHCYLDPSIAVTSGTSNTQFDVGSGDIGKFSVGRTILIHNADYTDLSPEVTITNITGTTITCDDLGFTPDNTMTVELIGFPDFDGTHGGPYRFI